jgi:hypothetical protein
MEVLTKFPLTMAKIFCIMPVLKRVVKMINESKVDYEFWQIADAAAARLARYINEGKIKLKKTSSCPCCPCRIAATLNMPVNDRKNISADKNYEKLLSLFRLMNSEHAYTIFKTAEAQNAVGMEDERPT